jgi:hypothetical protein
MIENMGVWVRTVTARIFIEGRHIAAHFYPSTGRLMVREGVTILEAIQPPDSWIALAAVNAASCWGTRPTFADLQIFLERYVLLNLKFLQE